MFPVAAGMFLIAPSAVALLLGERWLEVAVPLQAFAIVAASDAVGSVFFPVLIVTGGARLSMYIGLAGSILFPAVFYFGSAGGVVGVTTAYAVVAPLLRVPAYLGVASRTGLTIRRYARALWPALSATAVMAIAIVAIRQWVPPSWPLASGLVVDVLVGAPTYGLVLGTAHRGSVARVYRILRSVRAAPTRAATAIAPLPPIAA